MGSVVPDVKQVCDPGWICSPYVLPPSSPRVHLVNDPSVLEVSSDGNQVGSPNSGKQVLRVPVRAALIAWRAIGGSPWQVLSCKSAPCAYSGAVPSQHRRSR